MRFRIFTSPTVCLAKEGTQATHSQGAGQVWGWGGSWESTNSSEDFAVPCPPRHAYMICSMLVFFEGGPTLSLPMNLMPIRTIFPLVLYLCHPLSACVCSFSGYTGWLLRTYACLSMRS